MIFINYLMIYILTLDCFFLLYNISLNSKRLFIMYLFNYVIDDFEIYYEYTNLKVNFINVYFNDL